jgi:pimeloyl-ACP methyl ester carboxylesterase
MLFFAGEGFRVIAHDRRGHGRSTQTDGGHDMITTPTIVRHERESRTERFVCSRATAQPMRERRSLGTCL